MAKSKSATQIKTDELLARLRANAVVEVVPDGFTCIADICDAVGLSPQTVGRRLMRAGVERVKVRCSTGFAYAYHNGQTLAAFSGSDGAP